LIATGPVLSVTDCNGLVEPTAIVAKERLYGATVAFELPVAGEVPVPDKATVCGLLAAVSVNVKVAVRVPVVVGVNAMSTVQPADGARPVPHALPEILKSPGFVPVTAMLLREIAVPAPFCNVVDCEGPLEPTLTVPKERDGGFTVAAVAPSPESETVSVDMPPVWVNVRVAVRAPAAVGTKSKVAVQLDLALRIAPQVLAEIEKSLAFAPVMATLLIVIADVPSLVSVTISAFPADPTGTLSHETLLGLTVTTPARVQPVCCKADHARKGVSRSAPAGLSRFAILGLGRSPRVRAEDTEEKRNEARARPKPRPEGA
jgi:hypothetical protein